MNKRGASVQNIIIGIIILLVTAAIIFFFFKALPYKETVDKEACHQSAILRNNMFLKGEFGPQIPLNCKTQEIVISSTSEEEIKREIANAMYDCWWMLGEGKLNFFQRKPTFNDPSYCVICAIISFDENTQKKVPRIEGMTNYLILTKIPQKNITYWDYITSGEAPLKDVADPVVLETNRKYAIIYSLTEKSTLAGYLGGGSMGAVIGTLAGAAVGTLVFPGGGTVAGVAIGSKIGMVIGGIAGGRSGTFIGEQAGEKLQEVIEKSDYLVTFWLIPLEAEAIKNFKCNNIESIP